MKQLLFIARIFSTVFRPSYYPTVGTFILLCFTYLSLFPWVFKLWILALVYTFTFCLPDGQREKIGVDTPLPSGLSPELGIAVECFRSLWFKTDAGDNDCGD